LKIFKLEKISNYFEVKKTLKLEVNRETGKEEKLENPRCWQNP
jgi:hypothetical protein